MNNRRDVVDSLEDILSAAKKAQSFTADIDFAEFEQDEKTAFAVVRAFEILGEATGCQTSHGDQWRESAIS